MNVNMAVWIIEVGVGILVLIAANYAMKQIMAYFRKRSLTGMHDWREKVDQIFYFPLYVMLWIIGVVYVVDIVGSQFGFQASLNYLKPLRNAAIVGCFGWCLVRWKTHFYSALLAKRRDEHKIVDLGIWHVFGRLLSIAISILTVLIALQFMGMNIAPLLAFGGIGAAAIGFAGKDVIANFFGGLMIHITRPFTLTDQVSLPEKNIEGTVEEIGWYLTSIRDKDKRPIYVPNAVFSTLLVINLSRMSHRRILETIDVRSSDFSKLKAITEEIKRKIAAHGAIDKNLPILVFFNSFREYSLGIYIDVYTLETRFDKYLAVKEEILMRVQEIITAAGAEIPTPTYTIHQTPTI